MADNNEAIKQVIDDLIEEIRTNRKKREKMELENIQKLMIGSAILQETVSYEDKVRQQKSKDLPNE